MNVRTFPRSTQSDDIETTCEEWAHEEPGTDIVAIELIDHPDAAYDDRFDSVTGPWVVGRRDEVNAWLAAEGHDDIVEQYHVQVDS